MKPIQRELNLPFATILYQPTFRNLFECEYAEKLFDNQWLKVVV